MPDLIVLLPTRDEESGIGEVIDRIPISSISSKGYGTRVVVVDGNSTDSTCEIAEAKGAELIRQKSSQGKGWGVREALKVIFNGHKPNGAPCITDPLSLVRWFHSYPMACVHSDRWATVSRAGSIVTERISTSSP